MAKKIIRIGLYIGAGIALTLWYVYFFSFALSVNSDNAYFVRAAEDMRNGNILLRGWYGGYFTALTGDILSSCLLGLVFSRKIVFYLTGPLVNTLIVMISALLVSNGFQFSSFKEKIPLYLAILPIVVVPVSLRFPMMTIGMHGVAIAYILILYCLLGRLVRSTENRPISLCLYLLILLAGCLADGFVFYFFAVPALAALVFAAVKGDVQRKTGILLIILTACGGVLSKLCSFLLDYFGYLQLSAQNTQLTAISDIPRYLSNTLATWLRIFGAPISNDGGIQTWGLAQICGAICALLVLFCIVIFILRFYKLGFIDLSLLAGFLCSAGSFTFTTVTQAEEAVRYLSPAFYLGVILTARLILEKRKSRLCLVTSVSVLAVFACFNIPLEFHGSPLNNQTYTDIAGILQDHNVTHVYGTYWESHSLYYYSDGRIEVAPVKSQNGRIAPDYWSVRGDWYEPDYGANCLLVNTGNAYGLTQTIIWNEFGQYSDFTSIDGVDIYFYDHNISELLAATAGE